MPIQSHPELIRRLGQTAGCHYPVPAHPPTTQAVAIVRLVNSAASGPVALLGISDEYQLILPGGEISADARTEANRLLVRQTGVGFVGGRVEEVAILDCADGVRTLLLLHDLTGAKSDAALTDAFFAAARAVVGASRQLALPITRDAFRLVMAMPRLKQDAGTTLALTALAQRSFGRGFAHELACDMDTPTHSRSTSRVTFAKVLRDPALAFLTTQLAADQGVAL